MLGVLEELDEVISPNGDEGDLTDIEAFMFKLFSDDEELDSISEIVKEADETEAAIERLTAIKDVISVYGISRPVMEACDPRGELVQRGLIGAYEKLGIISTKGDLSIDATEAVGKLINELQASRAELLKKVKDAKDAGKKKYGDVEFADEENSKYPIDSVAHIKAAWSYIHQKRNAAKYTPAKLKVIKDRIKAAAKKNGIELHDKDEA